MQAHGGLELGHGFVEPVQLERDEARVEADGGILRSDLCSFPVDLAGLGQTPQLEGAPAPAA